MPTTSFSKIVKFIGFVSSIVGFSCFALGPSFQNLFGRWSLLKIVVYCSVSFLFSVFMLFVKEIRLRFPRIFWLKAPVCFLVLLLTSLYSYYEDRGKEGKTAKNDYRSMLSLISFGAFALMSMTLSTQMQPGFEVGMSNFFLGCLVVGVMKKNFMVGLGVAVLCFVAMIIRWYFQRERGHHGDEEHNRIFMVGNSLYEETPIRSPFSMHPSQEIRWRRRQPLLTPPIDSNILDWDSDSDVPAHYDPFSPFSTPPLRQISFNALRYVSCSNAALLSFLSSRLTNIFTIRLVRPFRLVLERRGILMEDVIQEGREGRRNIPV